MSLYRGSGGAIFEITPPGRGSLRENFDAAIARGDLVPVDDAEAVAAPVEEQPEEVPVAEAEPEPAPTRTRADMAAASAPETSED